MSELSTSTPPTSPRQRTFSIRHNWPNAMRLWLIAAGIGMVVGGAVIIFRLTIMGGEFFFFNAQDEKVTSTASELSPLHVVMAPVVGGAIVGALLGLGSMLGWGKRPRPFSVADVMKARRYPKRMEETGLNLRDGLLSALISAISLGAGASSGREGPAVHLGAVLARLPAIWLNLDIRTTRTLLGCGAAAAVSASFHAPLAGVLFAREIILQRYRIADIGPVAVSSVAAALTARSHFGSEALFVVPEISEPPVLFFAMTPMLGLLAAGLALMAIWTWSQAPEAGERIAERLGLPVWVLPPCGGLILGLFALAFPQVLGVGYEPTAAALAGVYGPVFMIILVFAKLAATSLCIGAHFGGGVFSPSLYIGAMMGGAFGILVGLPMDDPQSALHFFTIVGMGAVSGAVLGAPISTTLIVFELTSSYETAAAVLVSVSLATVLVQTQGGALFERQVKFRMRQNY